MLKLHAVNGFFLGKGRHPHDQRIFSAHLDELADVNFERRVPAFMPAREFSVDPHFTAVNDPFKAQQGGTIAPRPAER